MIGPVIGPRGGGDKLLRIVVVCELWRRARRVSSRSLTVNMWWGFIWITPKKKTELINGWKLYWVHLSFFMILSYSLSNDFRINHLPGDGRGRDIPPAGLLVCE